MSLGLSSWKRLLASKGGYLLARMLTRHMLLRLMSRHASAAETRVRTGLRRVVRLLNGMNFSEVLVLSSTYWLQIVKFINNKELTFENL